jgi:hypothetical protein
MVLRCAPLLADQHLPYGCAVGRLEDALESGVEPCEEVKPRHRLDVRDGDDAVG